MSRPATTTRARRRSQRPTGSRAGILGAAATIFSKAGLAGARMDVIAAAAGVNKALLYYYFKSKESLYEAVIEEHFSGFNRQALELLNAKGSAREILLRYAGMHFDFICSQLRYAPLYHQLMVTGGKPLNHLVKKYFLPRSQALARLLERGMRDGEFRRASVTNTSISIVALIVFYFSAAQVLERLGHTDAFAKANLKRRRQETLDFIRHGIFKEPEASLK
jgi:TetR/AcrR family transcriptional regulator